MKKLFKKFLYTNPIKLYLLLSVLFFLVRFIPLTAQYGIEHDSGWYLGVAKNLAHKGIYASNTNTVAYEGEGAFPSIHNKFSVQDKEGYVYFPAGVTVGPGYIVPQAIFLKVFGDGWWQYRIWPVMAFTIFLILLFVIVHRLGGIIALILFQLWLWFLPQLNVNYSFEALSENLALTLVLGAILIFPKAYKTKKLLFYFLVGMLLSFAFLTKNLYLLNGLIFIPLFLYEIVKNRKEFKKVLWSWILLGLGFLLPVALFESYRIWYLTTHFGIESWHAVNKEIQLTYQWSGSGLDALKKCLFDEKLFMGKFKVWFDIGLYQYPFVWIGFISMPLVLFTKKQNRLLVLLLYSAAFISFLWFVLLSPLGWGRHVYHALIIAMMLICVSTATLFRLKGLIAKLLAICLCGFIVINIMTIPKANGKLVLSDTDINNMFVYREERVIQGFPSIVLIPQSRQQEVINFFKRNIGPNDKIYYLDAFVLAEVGTLTDTIIYPWRRLVNAKGELKKDGNAYLMLGPYQIASYKLVDDNYFTNALKKCDRTVFQNDHYFICKITEKSIYE